MCALAGWWSSRKRRSEREVSFGQWTSLFFLAIVTHPLLDCFTAYGTQLFEPFSADRLAWNTISVVDPLYTLPFLLLLILAARSGRETQVRRHLNTAGLIVSSAYLLLTVVNHFNVGSVLEQSLQEEQLVATRSLHSPSIGNNLLWSATVQTDNDTYYLSQYSILDEQRRFDPFLRVEGRHDLLTPYAGNREIEILKWFTKGYYTVVPADSGRVQLSDLRYGLLGDDPDDPGAFIFSWTVDTTQQPVRVLRQRGGPEGDRGEMLSDLWERIGGID
jgi:inner membrane protein